MGRVNWKDSERPDFKDVRGDAYKISLDELKTLYLKIDEFDKYLVESFSKKELVDMSLWNPFMLAKGMIRNVVSSQMYKKWKAEE